MGIGIRKILAVKLPVTHVAESVAWYQDLLDLELLNEFIEDDVLRGAGLIDRESGVMIALRDREAIEIRPRLDGFDVCLLEVESVKALEGLVRRCKERDIPCQGIEKRPDGQIVDIPDPDGTVLRFYHYIGWEGRDDRRFRGLEFGPGGLVGTYDTPRLVAGKMPTTEDGADG
ncbi:MAG: VOC family protein [Actinomycetota bacterium]|nr:VOC family protein [Actinomycetota bacterium]